MKIRFILLTCLLIIFTAPDILSSQSTKTDTFYKNKWKEVDNFFKKGLPKSANKDIELIYRRSKKENNSAQFIKSLIYKMKYNQNVEEESVVKINNFLREELKQSEFPVTPVLHSLIADNYWSYYSRNRYKILNRSQTVELDENDIRTWDINKITEQAIHHYALSLAEAKKLQQTKISIYDEITKGDKTTRIFRPTLYDFLVHRANPPEECLT